MKERCCYARAHGFLRADEEKHEEKIFGYDSTRALLPCRVLIIMYLLW